MAVWQTVIALVGVFVAVVALYAALGESEAVRKQTAASVWPIVQFRTFDARDGEDASFTFQLINAGVGPARMRGMRLVIDGRAMRDWNDLITTAGDGELRPAQRQFVRQRVLRPGEEVAILFTQDPVLAPALAAVAADPATQLTFCYCSIFDDCWLGGASEQAAAPQPVDACPDFGDEGFVD
jgi:hypothetical protein